MTNERFENIMIESVETLLLCFEKTLKLLHNVGPSLPPISNQTLKFLSTARE